MDITKTEHGTWLASCTEHGGGVEFMTRKAARAASHDEYCTGVKPETKSDEPKPLTRQQCKDLLTEHGYTGPTSYTMPKLRGIVAWTQAGSPKDGDVPNGAIAAVYPEEKKVTTPKKSKGYRQALTDLSALLDSGADLDAVRAFAEEEAA